MVSSIELSYPSSSSASSSASSVYIDQFWTLGVKFLNLKVMMKGEEEILLLYIGMPVEEPEAGRQRHVITRHCTLGPN